MSESDFLIVRPITISDAILTSTSVADTVAAYNAGTTYALGQQVRSDATHRVYESLANSNLGNALTDVTKWLDIGPTNPWAMFDSLNSTQTTAADEIEVVFEPGSRVDVIGLLNTNATSARVIAEDSIDGTVFDQTFSLVSDSGIVDWYTYFTEPIEVETDLVVTGLPALYSGLTFTVTLLYAGATVACGALVAGLAKVAGVSLAGASTGILDFSRKSTDDFGNVSITERGYANKGNFRIVAENSNIVSVQRLLSEFRAAPALYVGSENFANTFIYGFFRDFSIAIEQPTQSIISIELEGLL